ncbi:MAG: UPF0182 family protein, partial [Bdellovibrionales bacterium]|nr:UPF0182 family protein [Bdellovibrionales bacterium]
TRQALRPYYNFADVDVDRYMIDGRLRQVVMSLREVDLEQDRVPQNIKDGWNNRHLVYTHGMGIVLGYANEFDGQGLPAMRIKNIPAVSDIPEIQPSQEGIYFGERATQHIYVNTGLAEFHYPRGEEDAETSYEGPAGVELSSGLDKFAVAWKFDGWRTYTSNYLSQESRIVCRRTISERVKTLAPFLELDEDPYPVVTESGRVVYIQDAYTVSDHYPYSEPLRLGDRSFHPAYLDGNNYIRNSVKVTMDTYTGEVKFYVFDQDCVVLKVWQKAFPGLFTPKDQMPQDILEHVRYPEDMLKCQTEIYTTYHMGNTRKFISREGVWEVATEMFNQGSLQFVEPYSAIVQLPGEEMEEYLMMVQCTPSGKLNLAAWLAGRSSGEHYGKLIVYRMPLQSEVAGPLMVENFIDSKDEWSQDISLWNDNGSALLRGNLLTLPVAEGLVYIEPIYLQSDNEGAMPKLTRVVLGTGERLAWGVNLEDAKRALFSSSSTVSPETGSIVIPEGKELGYAKQLLDEYFRLSGEGNPAEAGLKLQELQRYLSGASAAN